MFPISTAGRQRHLVFCADCEIECPRTLMRESWLDELRRRRVDRGRQQQDCTRRAATSTYTITRAGYVIFLSNSNV